jgi:hypothetical protein
MYGIYLRIPQRAGNSSTPMPYIRVKTAVVHVASDSAPGYCSLDAVPLRSRRHLGW